MESLKEEDVNEILSSKKNKSKNLNLSDMTNYVDKLNMLLKSEEFSEAIEDAIFEGPPEISMKVLEKYIIKPGREINQNLFYRFLSSERFKSKNGGININRLIYLWIQFYKANLSSSTEAIRILEKIAECSCTKGNSPNKSIVELIKKQILPELLAGYTLPIIVDKVTEIEWLRLSNLFILATFGSNLKKSEERIQNIVYSWLEKNKFDIKNYNVKNLPMLNEFIEKNALSLNKQDDSNSQILQNEKNEGNEGTKLEPRATSWREGIQIIEKNILELESIRYSSQAIVDKLDKKIHELQSECTNLKVAEKILYSKLQEKEQQMHSLHEEIESLIISKKDIENKMISLCEFNETISRDRARAPEEFTNRIASTLRTEYKDYIEAETIQMNTELGENMRIQLRSIFDILEQFGICFK